MTAQGNDNKTENKDTSVFHVDAIVSMLEVCMLRYNIDKNICKSIIDLVKGETVNDLFKAEMKIEAAILLSNDGNKIKFYRNVCKRTRALRLKKYPTIDIDI